MTKNLSVLPNPVFKPKITNCALLEGNIEEWIVCCTRRFCPLARRISSERARLLAKQDKSQTDNEGLGKDDWVEETKKRIERKREENPLEFITRKIPSNLAGIQFSWWADSMCNAVGGVICSLSCSPAAGLGPLGYGVCVMSCSYFIVSPLCTHR